MTKIIPIDERFVGNLSRCSYAGMLSYLNIDKAGDPSTGSVSRWMGELFSSTMHTGNYSLASMSAQNYIHTARQETVDRISDAADYLSGKIEKSSPGFDASGEVEMAGMFSSWGVRSYGSYWGQPESILSFSYEKGVHLNYDADTWKRTARIKRMMYAISSVSISDPEAFLASVRRLESTGECIPEGIRESIPSAMHLATDSGNVFPPLIKPISVHMEPQDIVVFASQLRDSIAKMRVLMKNEGEYREAVAAHVNAGVGKCYSKDPCRFLPICPYGRYLAEQPLSVTINDVFESQANN